MKEHHGISCDEQGLKEFEQTWRDIDESIEYCDKHPCKLNKGKV